MMTGSAERVAHAKLHVGAHGLAEQVAQEEDQVDVEPALPRACHGEEGGRAAHGAERVAAQLDPDAGRERALCDVGDLVLGQVDLLERGQRPGGDPARRGTILVGQL